MPCVKATLFASSAHEAASIAAKVWRLDGYRLEVEKTTFGEQFTATMLLPGESDDGDSELMYGYTERGDSRWHVRRGA